MTALAPVGGSSPLAALAKAALMLDKAADLEDVKVIRDQAEVLRAYAKQAQAGLEVQNRCAELKLRAERKAGAMLATLPKNRGGRSTADTLSAVGIAHHESSRWQSML